VPHVHLTVVFEWIWNRLSKSSAPESPVWQTGEPVEPIPALPEAESRTAACELFEGALKGPDPIQGLIRADAILKATVDSRVRTIIQESHGEGQPAIMCAKGCSHCCRVSVSAYAFEAFAIADHLNRHWSGLGRMLLLRRIDKYRDKASHLRGGELPPNCPFLRKGICSIHSVRPSICRTHHSTDVKHCIANPKKQPPGARPFYQSCYPLYQGVYEALGERGGKPLGLDLAPAVGVALRNPQALSQFAAGADPFESARKGRLSRVR
jgi:Fe-S-cluster containining protein